MKYMFRRCWFPSFVRDFCIVTVGPIFLPADSGAMGKLQNCGMRNAEGKMRNGMCGATVIGRDITPHDRICSAFHRTLCVDCMEVNCIVSMWKITFCTVHANLDAGFWTMLMNVENNNHLSLSHCYS